MIPDLLVCGLGPAGRALAHRALAYGLTVTVVDPHPMRRWTATYAAWADELPSWLPAHTIAATVPRPVAWGTRRFEIDRPYVVFNVAALQDSLDVTEARVIADRVEQIHWRPRARAPFDVRRSADAARPTLESEPVPLSDKPETAPMPDKPETTPLAGPEEAPPRKGREAVQPPETPERVQASEEIEAARLSDRPAAAQPSSGEPVAAGASDGSGTTRRSDQPRTAQPSRAPEVLGWPDGQEAVRLSNGTVLRARRVIDARGLGRSPSRAEQTAYGVVLQRDQWNEAIFMDWRSDNGAPADAPPSFLYAVPLSADTILLEETCLAGRPPLPITELRDRLHIRLRRRGIELDGTEPVERVRFPLEGGRPGGGRFGAAGGLLHPATGYSIAATFAATDAIIASVTRRITDSTDVPG
ncbi:lycopene cyclase family protein, partial [Nocardia alni]|uniref:lycopene cyclase family protein n=1 Tax=Nocardia alni TaxID=2815723 RepID=UPI0027DF6F82